MGNVLGSPKQYPTSGRKVGTKPRKRVKKLSPQQQKQLTARQQQKQQRPQKQQRTATKRSPVSTSNIRANASHSTSKKKQLPVKKKPTNVKRTRNGRTVTTTSTKKRNGKSPSESSGATETTTSTNLSNPQKKALKKAVPDQLSKPDPRPDPPQPRNELSKRSNKRLSPPATPSSKKTSPKSTTTTKPNASTPKKNTKSPTVLVNEKKSVQKKNATKSSPLPRITPNRAPSTLKRNLKPPTKKQRAKSISVVRKPSVRILKRASTRALSIHSFSDYNQSLPFDEEKSVIAQTLDPFANANISKFYLKELYFDGSFVQNFASTDPEEHVGDLDDGMKLLQSEPLKYIAMYYQTSVLEWPPGHQKYKMYLRSKTVNCQPHVPTPRGTWTLIRNDYLPLPRFPNDQLTQVDAYTNTTLARYQSQTLRYLQPGRGMGLMDTPNIKCIGEVDPSDVLQGHLGNCWLMSGISSLAEFDGAVKKLFRKTPQLELVRDVNHKNSLTAKRNRVKTIGYTVTLWDLTKWKEVDIWVDERLPEHPSRPSELLGAKPSEDGELWVCYLEKAVAAHCGGWDKITGGVCTHTWSLLTGCPHQYTVRKNPATGNYYCSSKIDPETGKLLPHTNSPHDCSHTNWKCEWPAVGGGGSADVELTPDEVFVRLCAWDDVNYIMSACREQPKLNKAVDGMMDNHAYSVIECLNNVANTQVDLVKVRNPWGYRDAEYGDFQDNGPGWKRYPQIQHELQHVFKDDGIFWLTREDFFELFDCIFLSASDMTEFLA